MADEKFDKVKYKNEFIAKAYDRINLTVPKGKKAEIKAFAEKKEMSVNSFICDAIEKAMSQSSEDNK